MVVRSICGDAVVDARDVVGYCWDVDAALAFHDTDDHDRLKLHSERLGDLRCEVTRVPDNLCVTAWEAGVLCGLNRFPGSGSQIWDLDLVMIDRMSGNRPRDAVLPAGGREIRLELWDRTGPSRAAAR